jgi:hypothetical protein
MSDLPLPEEPSAEQPKSSGWKGWAAAGVVTALVVGGGMAAFGRTPDVSDSSTAAVTASADASTDEAAANSSSNMPMGGRGTSGTVASIDGSTLTVTSSQDDSTVTVETSDDTVVTEQVEGSLDDLAVGDTITVMGETADDGSVAATSVVSGDDVGGFGGPGGGGQPPAGAMPSGEMPTPPTGADGEMPTPPDGGQFGGRTSGTITSISNGTIVVETDDGEVTVTTSDDTTVSIVQTLTVADLEEGDTVQVMGQTNDAGTVTAERIQVGEITSGFGGGPGGMGGPPGGMTPPDASGSTADSGEA